MTDTLITTHDVKDGSLLGTDLASNADVLSTQILGVALTQVAGGTLTGTISVVGLGVLDASSGALIIPKGAVVPASTGDGRPFWNSTNRKLYVDNGLDVVAVAGNLFYTGILTGGLISINGGDNSKFDITAGEGLVVNNHTNPLIPVITRVTWSTFTAVTPVGLATDDFTFLAIDGSGSLVQQTSDFTFEQTRDLISLGRVVHPNHVFLIAKSQSVRVAFNGLLEASDFVDVFGSINLDGNAYSPNGVNLLVNKGAGQTWRLGANYSISKKRPSITDDNASLPTSLDYSYRDGSGGWNTGLTSASVIPGFYDDGSGVLAAVPLNEFTIQVILHFGGSNISVIQYGQAVFTSLALAEAHITDTLEINPAFDQATFRCWLIVKEGATDLSDLAQAKFILAGKFGLIDTITGSSGGESNTASNIGSFGVGPFKQKSGVDLQFKNIAPASGKISVIDNLGNSDIDLDVVTTPSGNVVGTGRLINTTAPLAGGSSLAGDITLSVTDATVGAKGVVQIGTNINVALGVISVPTTPSGTPVGAARALNTTAPLTGGGDLSADRTLAVSVATAGTVGVVQPDGTVITVTGGGVITVPNATVGAKGVVQVGTNISVSSGTISVPVTPSGSVLGTGRAINTTAPLTGGGDLSADRTLAVSVATALVVGVVKPDGVVITVDGGGGITVPKATTLALGVVKVDGTTIAVAGDGTISATGLSAYNAIQDEGVAVTARNILNFIGSSLSAVDNPGQTRTDVSLSQSPAGSTSVVGIGRLINTTAPLAGGGDLSTDRTLSVAAATFGSLGVVQIGTNISVTGGGVISVPTTPSGSVLGTGRQINTSSPLNGGGDLTANLLLGVDLATAGTVGVVKPDGTTLAVDITGTLSVTATPSGSPVGTGRAINTTAPLTGGGNLSADRTLAVSVATALAVGVVKPDGTVITVDGGGGITVPNATVGAKGVVQVGTNISVSSGTISVPTTPSGSVLGTGRAINTTAPLTGGGDLSADRTLAVSVATAGAVGVVQPDGTVITVSGGGAITVPNATVGAKGVVQVGTNISVSTGTISVPTTPSGTPVGAARALNTTAPLTGGGDLSADRTLAVSVATAGAVGVVQPDGTVITVSGGGAITVPNATAGAKGVVQVGTNISVSTGTISVPTSPSGTPVGTARAVNTSGALTGGGDLSADRTLAVTTSPGAAATVVGTGRAINTTAPLTGGGDLSADRTLAVSVATAGAVGVVQPDGTVITVSGGGAITVPNATAGAKGVVQVGSNVSVTTGTISVTTLSVAIALNTTMTMNASGILDCTSGVLIIPNAASNPSSVGAGRIFFNTASNKTFIDNGTTLQKVAGWQLLAAVSLGANTATLSTGTIAARKHLMIRYYIPSTSNSIIPGLRFGTPAIDTGANYNSRTTEDGGVSTTLTGSANGIKLRDANGTTPITGELFVRNVAANTKSVIGVGTVNMETGGTAPNVDTIAGMWNNTAAQATAVQLNASAGTLTSGTELEVWGRDDE